MQERPLLPVPVPNARPLLRVFFRVKHDACR